VLEKNGSANERSDGLGMPKSDNNCGHRGRRMTGFDAARATSFRCDSRCGAVHDDDALRRRDRRRQTPRMPRVPLPSSPTVGDEKNGALRLDAGFVKARASATRETRPVPLRRCPARDIDFLSRRTLRRCRRGKGKRFHVRGE